MLVWTIFHFAGETWWPRVAFSKLPETKFDGAHASRIHNPRFADSGWFKLVPRS